MQLRHILFFCLCFLGGSVAYQVEKLDLVFLIDDSSRLGDLKGKNGRIHTVIEIVLKHVNMAARDIHLGLVTYNDKPLLPWVECAYTKNNYCSEVRDGLRSYTDQNEFLDEVAKIPFNTQASAAEPYTDAYNGLMTAIGDENIHWRESTWDDPVSRIIVIFAGAKPREGGQYPYGGVPRRKYNNGGFFCDCATEDYYRKDQVLSAIRQHKSYLNILTYDQFADGYTDIIHNIPTAGRKSIYNKAESIGAWIAAQLHDDNMNRQLEARPDNLQKRVLPDVDDEE